MSAARKTREKPKEIAPKAKREGDGARKEARLSEEQLDRVVGGTGDNDDTADLEVQRRRLR